MAWSFRVAHLVCTAFLLSVLAGCGGGGGGGDSSAGVTGARGEADPLAGTWLGAVEDNTGQLHTFRLAIANSRITAFGVDGIDFNATGPVTQDDARMFSSTVTFPQGQELKLVLIADPTGTHVVYLDRFFEFGVLQKNATALPAYASINVNGTWSGISVFTNFDEYEWDESSAICITLVCSVTEKDDRIRETFTGGFDSVFGRWMGTSVINLPGVPDISKVSRVFVSPDKKFMGVWRCLVGADGSILFPNKCTYSAWTKT